ncbi:MAG: phage shock protein PspA [Desulfobacterales bacterium]|nr:phage shock protein PspA [Desulfobacterales bacterium]
MGIFTRFRDIINSNISSMLDSAEDPEKLIKLMIREIEDTLVELKSSCADVLAGRKKVRRQLEEVKSRARHWAERAGLAVDKGRDDLAREALAEKRRIADLADSLDRELAEHDDMVEQYKDDIRQLEDKLARAREKERMLVQRHIQARRKKKAQEEIRRVDNLEIMSRFDDFENRIERMEAEAELVNYGKKPTMEEEFDKLAKDNDIEKELEALKTARSGKDLDEAR